MKSDRKLSLNTSLVTRRRPFGPAVGRSARQETPRRMLVAVGRHGAACATHDAYSLKHFTA
jgi:hypothetical protein